MKYILFSKSPRRQELMKLMQYDFRVETMDVDESYPPELNPVDISIFIAEKKAKAYSFKPEDEDQILISADTIVAYNNKILGKPADRNEAIEMLTDLSGNMHEVHTGVAIIHRSHLISFADTTKVFFRTLTQEEIEFYVDTFKPYDKAGAYGIQEWIGVSAVKGIEGSYTNVMGLPTEKLYQHLTHLTTK